MPLIRSARADDEPALRRIDQATWTAAVSPAPPPPADRAFFGPDNRSEDVLVAEVEGAVAGYARVRQPLSLPAHAHVLELNGLAVEPARQRGGVGRTLVHAALTEARRRGARKLSLRVLGPNAAARALYASCGFTVEGVLVAEFLLEGQLVDDVLMACDLTATA